MWKIVVFENGNTCISDSTQHSRGLEKKGLKKRKYQKVRQPK
jgi:hypothetical protein